MTSFPSINKAVIAAAGLASRFFPVTKTVPKQLIPVLDKAVIQYVVEEIAAAGIRDVIIVAGKNSELFTEYFSADPELNAWLIKRGKTLQLAEADALERLATITVIEQEPSGNGAPLLAAESLLRGEPFIFAFGDDLVKTKKSFTKSLLEEYAGHGKPVLGVQRVPRLEVSKYGVVRLEPVTHRVLEIVEKPDINSAPSELAEFGRMILNQEIVDALKQTPPGIGGELWIVDAIERYINKNGVIYALEVKDGAWYTTGDPLSHIQATIAYALDDERLRDNLKSYLKKLDASGVTS